MLGISVGDDMSGWLHIIHHLSSHAQNNEFQGVAGTFSGDPEGKTFAQGTGGVFFILELVGNDVSFVVELFFVVTELEEYLMDLVTKDLKDK